MEVTHLPSAMETLRSMRQISVARFTNRQTRCGGLGRRRCRKPYRPTRIVIERLPSRNGCGILERNRNNLRESETATNRHDRCQISRMKLCFSKLGRNPHPDKLVAVCGAKLLATLCHNIHHAGRRHLYLSKVQAEIRPLPHAVDRPCTQLHSR